MRLLLLLLASMLVAGPAAAQEGKPSSAPSAEDAKPSGPVSLERIREGLSAGPSKLTLSALEKPPDFKVEVQERHHLEEILATLDFKTGPMLGRRPLHVQTAAAAVQSRGSAAGPSPTPHSAPVS